jgi:hypothetical protein
MMDILFELIGIAVGVLLMAAPYYAESGLKAYASYLFWGGLTLTVLGFAAVVIIRGRGNAFKKVGASVADPRINLPTLEATRSSTIDATGAIIPGDLPFQFGKADDHSVIAMPGATVTRKDDGTILVTHGSGPSQFPAPTGEFSVLSNDDLKLEAQKLCESLRDLQRRFNEDAGKLGRNKNGQIAEADYKAIYDRYATEYRTTSMLSALSLASEFLSRLKSATPTTPSASNGARMILYKAFAGSTPASDVANFLDYLGQQLPTG